MSQILVSFGANYPGPWGSPSQTIRRALQALNCAGIRVERVSRFYETIAVGRAGQPNYINGAATIHTAMGPQTLLRRLKQVERDAGRRGGSPWGPRTLDIDILDYKGRVENWHGMVPGYARAGRRPLVLPHPWIESRPFVLRPLLDVAPNWRHPVTKESAKTLWHRIAMGREGAVMRAVCDHEPLASSA